MKGSPQTPRCGFSSKVVQALQQAHIEFSHFDILSDEAVRQGLKVSAGHKQLSAMTADSSAIWRLDAEAKLCCELSWRQTEQHLSVCVSYLYQSVVSWVV